MKTSETSAAKGSNQYFTIEDLPLDFLEKCAVLEWFARRLWVILEESSGHPDYYCKSYDPLVIDIAEAHSYVFDLEDGGRHHTFESLEHLERMLMDETISTLLYGRNNLPFICETCGQEYWDLSQAHYERQYWWCPECAAIKGGKLEEFPAQGKLIPKTLMVEDIW